MRVFILCTGRTGSTTIVKACQYMSNYTAAHESRTSIIGPDRFAFPDNHIEGDNRLSWQLGLLNEKFGNDAFYVHLKRNKDQVAVSYARRFFKPISIMNAFCSGIKMLPAEKLNKDHRLAASHEYIDTVDANIRMFLADKTYTMTIELETIKSDFKIFWERIQAEGELEQALQVFDTKHNASKKKPEFNLLYRIKLLGLRIWRQVETRWF